MHETLGGIILDINEIRELVSQFDQSSLTEFDLREGQFELYMNKNKTSRGMNMVQTNETLPVSEPVNVISEQATTAPEIMKEKNRQYLMESRLFRQSWESFICNQRPTNQLSKSR